ncbi:MAG: hypothetical protein RLZZ546_1991 [Bacteroidota bacterium]
MINKIEYINPQLIISDYGVFASLQVPEEFKRLSYIFQDKLTDSNIVQKIIKKIDLLCMEEGELYISGNFKLNKKYKGLDVEKDQIIIDKNSFLVQCLKQDNEIAILSEIVSIDGVLTPHLTDCLTPYLTEVDPPHF